jgi:hypothetical protein
MTERQIRVRPGGLTAFAEDVQRGTAHAFQPDVERAQGAMGDAVPFGAANAGLDVLAAKQSYAAALDASMENMRRFAQAAGILSGVAQQAAAAFRSADSAAAVDLDQVTGMLTGAASRAQTIGTRPSPSG